MVDPSTRTVAEAAIAECRFIATMTEEPGRITRRFLTPAISQVHTHLRSRMETLGMSVTVDHAGNLRGLWAPANCGSKRLLLGSHIDTVPDAGAFDGVLGVVLALEWVRIAQLQNLNLAIEIIAFSDEEGVRYGVPFLGSRAVAGTFKPEFLALEDDEGISMQDSILAFGLDPLRITEAVLDEEVLGFIEIHIEQGPVLESEGLQLAVVDGIVGQSRLNFRFRGQANHAGTTPMHLRRDALAGAAELVLSVESAANQIPGLMATVGRILVEPNAGNVIASSVEVTLDVRHVSDATRFEAVHQFVTCAKAVAQRRDLCVESVEKMNQPAISMDQPLTAELLGAMDTAGYPSRRMPSGAGHDAMIMAQKVPTAMLFLRSPGGLSHHPKESVVPEDVEAALQVGSIFLQRLNPPKELS